MGQAKRDRDFLNAAATARASYSWKSIIATMKILADGLKWKIGNGRKVKIFKDKWLSEKCQIVLQCIYGVHRQHLDVDARVLELVDENSTKWNEG